jgi:hypothetical protein
MGRILGSESITEDELEFFVKTAGAASTSSNTVPTPGEEHLRNIYYTSLTVQK